MKYKKICHKSDNPGIFPILYHLSGWGESMHYSESAPIFTFRSSLHYWSVWVISSVSILDNLLTVRELAL